MTYRYEQMSNVILTWTRELRAALANPPLEETSISFSNERLRKEIRGADKKTSRGKPDWSDIFFVFLPTTWHSNQPISPAASPVCTDSNLGIRLMQESEGKTERRAEKEERVMRKEGNWSGNSDIERNLSDEECVMALLTDLGKKSFNTDLSGDKWPD